MHPPDHPHILFLVSSPLTADPVAVDRALQELADALRTIPAPATFITRVAEADAIGALMARRDRPRFSVLHYLGHGYKPEEVPSGYLIFEDQNGDLRPLQDHQLLGVLNPTGSPQPEFRLAVVTACHSESVAAALYALGIPHIVAVDAEEAVTQRAAITFFCRFYGVLLTGGTVAEAFRAGQNAVALDEDLCRLGERVALAEARKFRLLPEDGDHDRPLWPALPEGQVQVEPLPALTRPPFHLRPARFLGRGEEMRDVLSRLRERRAVLLRGVSGVGKTELAK
ncbi:MAG: CHAT domain-containing protein, partial [Chloroflexia bacterium]